MDMHMSAGVRGKVDSKKRLSIKVRGMASFVRIELKT
jgi:hypothetical protein